MWRRDSNRYRRPVGFNLTGGTAEIAECMSPSCSTHSQYRRSATAEEVSEPLRWILLSLSRHRRFSGLRLIQWPGHLRKNRRCYTRRGGKAEWGVGKDEGAVRFVGTLRFGHGTRRLLCLWHSDDPAGSPEPPAAIRLMSTSAGKGRYSEK